MRKYSDTIIDLQGNVVSGASVTVYLAGTTTKADLYSEDDVTKPLANPLSTDPTGSFEFYADNNRYDLVISGAGLTAATKRDVLIFDPAGFTAGPFVQTGSAYPKDITTKLKEVVSLKDFGVVGTGVSDDTTVFDSFISYLNLYGGAGIVPYGTYKLGKNYTITKAGVNIDFQGSTLDIFNAGTLNTADSAALITILADKVQLKNADLISTAGLRLVGIRAGDYAYNGAIGTQYKGIVVENIQATGLGKSGVGCGSVVFAALRSSHARNITTVNSQGQSFAMYGCINCTLDGADDENNGETAFYIGSNQPTAVYSENCWMKNLRAKVDSPSTGIFTKVSRGAVNCGVEDATFYAKGNGTTFRKIDPVNNQPAVWMQSGFKTTFRNINLIVEDMDQQTVPYFGMYAHSGIAPLDGILRYPVMDTCLVRTLGTTAKVDGMLLYPVAGLGVIKPTVRNCDWSADGVNSLDTAIHAYANDAAHGKVLDLIVADNRFVNCTYGVVTELGPNGAAGDIGNVRLGGTNSVFGSTPATYYNILSGTLITSSNDSAPVVAPDMQAADTLALNRVAKQVRVRLLKNTSGSTITVQNLSGVSTDEGAIVIIVAQWDVGTGNSIVLKHGGTGKFRLAGNVDFTLGGFSGVILEYTGGEWVERARRT